MKTILIIYTMITFCVGCKQLIKPKIIQFSTYTKEIDSTFSLGKTRVIYNYFFLVQNYSTKNEVNAVIDSFANNFLESGKFSPNKEEVRLWFYKETSKTNMETIRANPREVDRYSNEHDLIWGYTLQRNNNLKKEKIKNGEVIETNSNSKFLEPNFKIEKVE